jgi:hypothetical protein
MKHTKLQLIRYGDDLYCIDYVSPSIGMTLYSGDDRKKALTEYERLTAMDAQQLHDYVMSK